MTGAQQDQPTADNHTAKKIDVNYYTDPLCCWSWAFEESWQKLQLEFKGSLNIRYIMGGLIADWKIFCDPLNNVSKPVQMGPVWMEVKHTTGVPINDLIWIIDPPASSYPACIAVKTAALQSADAERIYLRKVREAVMIHGSNISKHETLLAIAQETAAESPQVFNAEQFAKEFNGEKSIQAFREDLQKVRYHQISRFPTITMSYGGKGILIAGYRPYDVLLEAVYTICPDLKVTAE
ncbi:MAG: DsbA family protein [Cytophaga sp.]|uniref:DsbA family protein n=1 Tax=Cytophaga sp. TaxID=29535 RepID=UPI003F80DD24